LVARNRKRAKDRRTSPVAARGAGVPSDRAGTPNGAPDPIAHATPDAELAAAHLAVGAPEPDEDLGPVGEEELDELATAPDGESTLQRPPARAGLPVGAPAAGAPAPHRPERVSWPARFITFLQGSWAELQRVQWPDRRQVMQATGVVIGFVIVAGVLLGLSDLASSHLMDWILK
jgi:preprotein translocase subunit SecE